MAQTICVLGLGYIGLPTASVLANSGHRVIGVDIDASVVDALNRGRTNLFEPGLKTLVAGALGSGNLSVRTTPCQADAFIIAVPTPFGPGHVPDLHHVREATEAIVPVLRPGALVVLESTSPPLTTRDLVAPLLSRSGLELGTDLFVAYCPERVLPGRILQEIISNHRVIGGLDPRSAELARALYASFVAGEIHLTDATTAEMVKLMENSFRDVNIALANELALMAERVDIDAWEVVRLANLHPRVNLHRPGPGVGGHCISVDPWFLVDRFGPDAKLVRTAREVNDRMPGQVVDIVLDAVAGIARPRVTALGLAYKANVGDLRESPAVEIVRQIEAHGVEVRAYDPYVREWDSELLSLEAAFQGSDLALLLVDHDEFRYLHPGPLGELMRRKVVFDTRCTLDRMLWHTAGFDARVLGKARLRRPDDAAGKLAVVQQSMAPEPIASAREDEA